MVYKLYLSKKKKVKHTSSLCPAIPLLCAHPRENKACLQKDLYEGVHVSFVHVIQRLDLVQMSTTRRMNKQTAINKL